jgi:coiled-coil domain-containing protein 77
MTKANRDQLIEYYKKRLETADQEYQEALDSIQELKISHEETHRLSWEVFKRSREVIELQKALGEFQTAVYQERKKMLEIVAENDLLKVQELKDRKKIRFLLSLSGKPEEEVTYFRDSLDKRLIKIARADTSEQQKEDLIILEDEVEGLKLTILSLKTQLEEQKVIAEASANGLLKEQRLIHEQNKSRQEYYEGQVKDLMEKLNKMRVLCRENTRELLRTKKTSHVNEKVLIEEKASLVAELKTLSQQLSVEKERNETVERVSIID